jgi:hypothetical protein
MTFSFVEDNRWRVIVSVHLAEYYKISFPRLRNLRHSQHKAIFTIESVHRYRDCIHSITFSYFSRSHVARTACAASCLVYVRAVLGG